MAEFDVDLFVIGGGSGGVRAARIAAGYSISPGRDWRPLVDTTNQPIISQRSPVSWVSYQRQED